MQGKTVQGGEREHKYNDMPITNGMAMAVVAANHHVPINKHALGEKEVHMTTDTKDCKAC